MKAASWVLAFASLGLAAGAVRAAEVATRAGPTPVLIERVRYKPGTAARLDELDAKYFYPSWRASGLEVRAIVFASGPWDRMYIVPLKEGFAALESKTLPEWVGPMAWRARQFGQAEADRVEQEYAAMIAEEDDEIAFVEN